ERLQRVAQPPLEGRVEPRADAARASRARESEDVGNRGDCAPPATVDGGDANRRLTRGEVDREVDVAPVHLARREYPAPGAHDQPSRARRHSSGDAPERGLLRSRGDEGRRTEGCGDGRNGDE